jgi:hypothetical protein
MLLSSARGERMARGRGAVVGIAVGSSADDWWFRGGRAAVQRGTSGGSVCKGLLCSETVFSVPVGQQQLAPAGMFTKQIAHLPFDVA